MIKSAPGSGPLLLTPRLQRYAWGDPIFIPQLFGIEAHGEPHAEAWFGAHPLAPASATVNGVAVPLDQLIAAHPAQILGPATQQRFGALPYLLKVLAAAKPLSIQVHPNKRQASAGFAAEQQAGLPLDAPDRCYRDSNHKPELLVALTDFDALCGFRDPAEIAAALESLPELEPLLPAYEPSTAGLRALLDAYFALPAERLEPALARLLERLAREPAGPHGPSDPAYWALEAHRALSPDGTPDRGLLLVFLLTIVHLRPGQAMFLPAGFPHAYLRGAGVELMASSDNVLRAGLTAKHVDPAELLRVVRFDAGPPPILEAVEDEVGLEGSYPSPAAELSLHRLRLSEERAVDGAAHGPETLLLLPASPDTTSIISWDGGQHVLRGARACLIPHGLSYRVETNGSATLFRATIPARTPAALFRGQGPTRLAFGTSGLRGLVSDITDLEAYINTRGFLDYLVASGDAVPGTPVALGGDLRPSTDGADHSIARAVARAISDAGLRVRYYGRIPTPALTHFGIQHGWPSIMVTGSHIPFDRNGIKFNKSSGEVLKSDEAAILAAVERVRRLEYVKTRASSLFDDQGRFLPDHVSALPAPSDAAAQLYVRRYLDAFPDGALAGLRLALYEHSAVGREVVAEILRGLGAEVHPVGRSETFVAIDTEAISEDRLVALQQLLEQVQAQVGPIDAIVSTDGDSDRPMLLGVDESGHVRFFPGDVLGAIVADYLAADAIAVPVSANDLIELHFARRAVAIARTRIGSPWVIAAMSSQSGERRVGWEANGGFLTGSRLALESGELAPLPSRDAVLPIVAALHAARRAGGPVVDLLTDLPPRFSKSDLLDAFPQQASRALLERFSPSKPEVRRVVFGAGGPRWIDQEGRERAADGELAAELLGLRVGLSKHFSERDGFGALEEIDYLDGIRMRFTGGDIAHVRPSGNAPQLRIYAIAASQQRADEVVALALAEPDGILRQLERAATANGPTATSS